MIDSFYTNAILIKIKSNYELEYFNIKINIGGGYVDINKNITENITNLYSGFSYYLFVLSSKDEKLNIKFITKLNEEIKPFNHLNVYEYSNKNTPLIYLQNTNIKFDTKIKNDKLISYLSYQANNNYTNFIAIEIIPNYNINFIECFIIQEKKEINSSSIS